MRGAAHGRVEQGAEDATVDRSDRVVQMLANLERERHPARLDIDDAHPEQGGDGRWRDDAPSDGRQIVQAAHVERQRGADHGVFPGDLATPR